MGRQPLLMEQWHAVRDGHCSKSSGTLRPSAVEWKPFLTCAPRATMVARMGDAFISARGPEPVGPYPHAHRAGGLLFVSGMGPRQRGMKDIPGVTRDAHGAVIAYDIETQCRAVFDNIRMILEDAGALWENIVDVTVFLTHMEDFPVCNRVYAEYFAGPGKPNPARTTVEVTRLPTPIAIEVKVIATA